MFVGKGYATNGLFKLNIDNKIISAYIVESLELWHERFGHVNFRSIKLMVNDGLIKDVERNIILSVLLVASVRLQRSLLRQLKENPSS